MMKLPESNRDQLEEQHRQINLFVSDIEAQRRTDAESKIGNERISGGLGMPMLVAALVSMQRQINELRDQIKEK
jgi:hypothetical protein